MDVPQIVEIKFDADYPGKIKDVVHIKFAAWGNALFFGILFTLVGAYVGYYDYYRVITKWTRIWGTVVMVAGICTLFVSPIIALLKRVNKGFSGLVTVTLARDEAYDEQQQSESADAKQSLWHFTLTTHKNGEVYADQGPVNMLSMHKVSAKLTTLKGNTYYIPLRCLSDAEKAIVKEIAVEVKRQRTVKPRETK